MLHHLNGHEIIPAHRNICNQVTESLICQLPVVPHIYAYVPAKYLQHALSAPSVGNELFHHPNYKLLSGSLSSWCFNKSFDLRCFSESCGLRRGRGPHLCACGLVLGMGREVGEVRLWALCRWHPLGVGFTRGVECILLQAGQDTRLYSCKHVGSVHQ